MLEPAATVGSSGALTASQRRYVESFRASAPYINAHRGRVFVVQLGGDAVRAPGFAGLVHDLALLRSLGVRLVLVHGARAQIEERLAARGSAPRYAGELRITDADALEAVKEAAGAVRLEIEALLSMGLPNSPMEGATVRVASGNFIVARPIGVRDGVDFEHTGEVRRVDADAIGRHLEAGEIVLISPVGFSPTGEVFNLSAEEIATEVAIRLGAAKLLLLGEGEAFARDADGAPARQLAPAEARRLLAESGAARAHEVPAASDTRRLLSAAIRACSAGVRRAHVLDRHVDGALLIELFTRDGIGTMVYADPYDLTRRAVIDDVGGILGLIEPLEREGRLVRRSREKLETEIEHFVVMERDGAIVACAAGYPFPDEGVVELACVAVHPDYEREGRGDALLEAVEAHARGGRARLLFVLTTHAVHWFLERGFERASLERLPVSRRETYNWKRGSKVLVKTL